MNSPRLIPVVALIGDKAVKTKAFNNPIYVGDPVNTVSLFSSFEAEELIVLDISRSFGSNPTSFETLSRIIESAYMPIAFGGGILDLKTANKIFSIGFDKVIIRTSLLESDLTRQISKEYGSQAVAGCIDISTSTQNSDCIIANGLLIDEKTVDSLIDRINLSNIGELILHDKDWEGSRLGLRCNWFTEELLKKLTIPIVQLGGCSDLVDAAKAIKINRFHSVAASSMFLFRPTRDAVLINYPETDAWLKLLEGEEFE